MTASRLQSIAQMLSRGSFVRHWLHWNHPAREPWLMAIAVRDENGAAVGLKGELEKTGFALEHTDIGPVYTIPRTTESGQPYRSPT